MGFTNISSYLFDLFFPPGLHIVAVGHIDFILFHINICISPEKPINDGISIKKTSAVMTIRLVGSTATGQRCYFLFHSPPFNRDFSRF